MNKITILLGVLLCLVAVNARHYDQNVESSDEDQLERKVNDHGHIPNRHRRRRWQMNYGYDYPPPPRHYYSERRDYDRNNPEAIDQILRILDEISTHIRNPPPPPQPVYIPYPVPYIVPQYLPCPKEEKSIKNPNITARFPEVEDNNQIWGIVMSKDKEEEDDGSDGARPISFEPITPKTALKRPAPKVEHGSSQDNLNQESTAAPVFAENQAPISQVAPGMCNAAILSCCGLTDQRAQKQCFTTIGCSMTYSKGDACSKEAISAAFDIFKAAYAPS